MDYLDPTLVLSGASNILQLEQNLTAFNFKLTDAEISELITFSLPPNYYWEERSNLEWN